MGNKKIIRCRRVYFSCGAVLNRFTRETLVFLNSRAAYSEVSDPLRPAGFG
jgi:hypothetical protein